MRETKRIGIQQHVHRLFTFFANIPIVIMVVIIMQHPQSSFVCLQWKKQLGTSLPCIHRSRSQKIRCANSQCHRQSIYQFPPLNQSIAAIIFGDGSESRLYPLTKRRSEGAIPIAANYRLIDAVVSNCINSGINKIYALTQFNSTSLNSHLSRAYSGAGLGKDGFVEVIAAYQSLEDPDWFQGSADAVRRCLGVLEEYPVTEFLVLPGHHLYRMDYRELVELHWRSEADITAAVLDAVWDQDPGFGSLKMNDENRVVELKDKTTGNPECQNTFDCLWFSSMGIYLINRNVMIKLLKESFPGANDFSSEVIRGAISSGMKVQAYPFDGYWEDMRSIGAFYRANMESTKKCNRGYNFFERDSLMYTLPRCLPSSSVTDSIITDSVIGDGCILNRCKITGAVVGMRTRIEDGAIIEDSVIMGSDIYQTDVQRNSVDGKCMSVPIGIGENTHIRKAIVDKNARIGKDVMIINPDNIGEGDREDRGYVIRNGIVVVLRCAVIPDGSIL
ncbi:LOW QUALITY PROTEIN: inactive glucose-1-phosphate adenylyltransferase small subunit 2, chloroplastic [Rhodamnia argentea]|uniref:LOW QUALITY PROTEIN: inactive glucose-1-phosphate adenylyltransferase small subunit 2, chloroplastic n=1 Tax=Rhodamnia argentea TaxID=178133 RepID=A0A8B8NZZ5_9MYRT|nr:LOW QUALITY PROTEIN: inactive glucose-1-phosphate adenylyltransferase small subunit 2, chloroplastic [Rhodamnia argentea]